MIQKRRQQLGKVHSKVSVSELLFRWISFLFNGKNNYFNFKRLCSSDATLECICNRQLYLVLVGFLPTQTIRILTLHKRILESLYSIY